MVGTQTKSTASPPQVPNRQRTNAPRDGGRSQDEGAGPGTLLRVAVSVALVWHLTAVFLAPLSIQPTSRLVIRIAQQSFMQWYLDILYINHGYHFFAPDPGPGHLIRYELLDERGGQLQTGEFPNRKEQWPRLWYHRHFMLADQSTLPSDDPQIRDHWQRRYLENYARHLLRSHEDAAAIRLRRVAHYPLRPEHALQGRKLNDPATYETLLEVTQRRSDLGPSADEQANLWENAPEQISTRPVDMSGWTGGRR